MSVQFLLLSTTVVGLNLLTLVLGCRVSCPDHAKNLVWWVSAVLLSTIKSMRLKRVPTNPAQPGALLAAYVIKTVVLCLLNLGVTALSCAQQRLQIHAWESSCKMTFNCLVCQALHSLLS
jgi:hypothetical protein